MDRQRSPICHPYGRPARRLAALLLLFATAGGCAGYRAGVASLYPPEIRTVYVPIFDSTSYRRNLGERLTEAVVKEIQLKTPFQVVNTPNADSVLTGTLVNDTKRVIVTSPTDEARESELTFQVQVRWVDRQGTLLRAPAAVAIPGALADVDYASSVVPEAGQSIVVGQQKAIQKIAEQIVGLMEAPW
ncbi:MAG: hypothetical protein K1X74_10785 [Pirellulales bacterium]|nr:hypothetical protein [Pirellulales bacterium]